MACSFGNASPRRARHNRKRQQSNTAVPANTERPTLPTPDRIAQVDAIRQALLALHKSLIDAQRITYERVHGRIETSSEFLGLVLEHPDFEWIRALSALMAQLDEWREEPEEGEGRLPGLLAALRSLLMRDGPNAPFSQRYWEMIDSTPEVLVGHVKLQKLLKN
jgi:hypothetical protein